MTVLQILHLEDDPLDRELVEAKLREDGLDVQMACVDSRDAFIEGLRSADLDLILSDFSLPEYDGMSALEAAHEMVPNTPFLFVSGAIGEDRAIETVRKGAVDYVLKDRLERLGPAVRRAMREVDHKRERGRLEAERDHLLVLEREARFAAESANRMKDEFLAVVSHELRTPLNAILGWTRVLQLDSPDAALLARGLSTIERNALAQSRLIEDVLDVSRIVTGKVQLEMRSIAVADYVDAAVEVVRPLATQKGVMLGVKVDPTAGTMIGDADRLQQVVWNLASNGVKFSPAGGSVLVRARRRDGWIEIAVADDGVGIPADALPRVFDRFFQADSSRTRTHRGLGLGLAIVRSLVEMHGGEVVAESPGLGKGSTFTVRFPARSAAASPSTGATREARTTGASAVTGVRVLVVDDEADSRELLRMVLGQNGALVHTASSAAEGMEALRTFEPDVLVCDIGMPEVDGYSMIRRVRALGGAVPAIALTAFARNEDRQEALAAGFHRHVTKPADLTLLMNTIAELARPADRSRA